MNERSEAVNRRVESNMGLVRAAAARFATRGMDAEDLFQTGSIGLIKAAQSFDESRGCAFSTYAFAMITGEIRRALRDMSPVRVSRRYRSLKTRADSIIKEAGAAGAELRISELAALLHEDERELAAAMSLSLPLLSLEEAAAGTGYGSAADTFASFYDTEEEAVTKAFAEELTASLTEWERGLIRLRYYNGSTQRAAAEALGVSQACVSRAEKRILGKLRKKAGYERGGEESPNDARR